MLCTARGQVVGLEDGRKLAADLAAGGDAEHLLLGTRLLGHEIEGCLARHVEGLARREIRIGAEAVGEDPGDPAAPSW
jgi:hypothetical protein